MSTVSGTWSRSDRSGARGRTARGLLFAVAGLLVALVLAAILGATTNRRSEPTYTVIAPAQSTWVAEISPASMH